MTELRVLEIWRHPVKSLQGESLAAADVVADGIRGDRIWGIRDEATGKILTGRREPLLLFGRARVDDADQPEITLPDGTTCTGAGPNTDAVLLAWLARPVSLVDSASAPAATAEFFADATDDTSAAIEWTMPPGRFVDAGALLMLTTASLRAARALHPNGVWDVRRFRPNVVLETDGDEWLEDGWRGRPVHVGTAVVAPQAPCVRCTMVTRPQPGLDRDLDVYRALARHHGGTFGMWSDVRSPGTITVGDRVQLG